MIFKNTLFFFNHNTVFWGLLLTLFMDICFHCCLSWCCSRASLCYLYLQVFEGWLSDTCIEMFGGQVTTQSVGVSAMES